MATSKELLGLLAAIPMHHATGQSNHLCQLHEDDRSYLVSLSHCSEEMERFHAKWSRPYTRDSLRGLHSH